MDGDHLTLIENAQLPVPRAYLDSCSGHWRRTRESIEHPIEGNKSIGTHPTLLGSKTFPGRVLGQRRQLLLHPEVQGNPSGGVMHFLIEPATPGQRLLIKIIEISEMHAGPKPIFDDFDG